MLNDFGDHVGLVVNRLSNNAVDVAVFNKAIEDFAENIVPMPLGEFAAAMRLLQSELSLLDGLGYKIKDGYGLKLEWKQRVANVFFNKLDCSYEQCQTIIRIFSGEEQSPEMKNSVSKARLRVVK
ncbi:hypothetical protein M4R22_02850 [Acidovorax sp. GBBC 3334]|uniref:hypothetical protein n=1 Tax=Acidovorax sp. GBBC 3334 TaxID=2940496 RepID=UPI00230337BE|nr:hypothetical protein [Acidovorax sp. GBBC 3334]MDA8453695.1 hypothetical protein [Acidovorax sp. GBBC 3334]